MIISNTFFVISSDACYQARLLQQREWTFSGTRCHWPEPAIDHVVAPSRGVAQQLSSSDMNVQPRRQPVGLGTPFETPTAASTDHQKDAWLSQKAMDAVGKFETFLEGIKQQTSPEAWLRIRYNVRHRLQSWYVNSGCLHSS